MSADSQVIWALTIYKLASLLAGVSSIYMGYRLFMSGIWGHAGELDATVATSRLTLKRAAPGTFFAVLGAGILCFTIYTGLALGTSQPGKPQIPERPVSAIPDRNQIMEEKK